MMNVVLEDVIIQNADKSAEVINYCPTVHEEPILRRCRVPGMWGKISLDWNSNPPLPRAVLQSSRVSEESKMVLKPCSVRVERCNVSSSSLVWGVEKVKLEDETVQLLYHGVRVREGDNDREMEIVDGSSEKKDDDMHEETQYPTPDLPGIGTGKVPNKCSESRFSKNFSINNNCPEKKSKHLDNGLTVKSEKEDGDKIEVKETEDQKSCFKCPKCGKAMPRDRMRFHMLTHYYQVFFDVLPDKKPFNCPLCDQISRGRVPLARHYAFSHGKIFELTDLTPEDLFYTERRMKELQQKNKSDEKQMQVLLASPLTEVSHDVLNTESVENITEDNEEKMEDSSQTTTLHCSVPGVTPFPLVKHEQVKSLDSMFAAEGMDEFGDTSAVVWSDMF